MFLWVNTRTEEFMEIVEYFGLQWHIQSSNEELIHMCDYQRLFLALTGIYNHIMNSFIFVNTRDQRSLISPVLNTSSNAKRANCNQMTLEPKSLQE